MLVVGVLRQPVRATARGQLRVRATIAHTPRTPPTSPPRAMKVQVDSRRSLGGTHEDLLAGDTLDVQRGSVLSDVDRVDEMVTG